KLFVETASNGQKYISEKIVDDNGVALGYGSFRCEWVEVMQGIKMSNINSSELQIKDIDGTDLAGVNAKYYKVEDQTIAELNANDETKITTNELIATKHIVFGAENTDDSFIASQTPVYRGRFITNTSYKHLDIKTGMKSDVASMYDVTLKYYTLGGGDTTTGQREVRFTGYIYPGSKQFLRAKTYIQSNTANVTAPYSSFGYIDTDGYVHLVLRNEGQLINTRYMFIEIYCNLYHFFYKSYFDNWSVSFSDTISNYDQNWGLQHIVTEGDTWQYWSGPQLLTSESFTSATLIRRYFTLLKPCTVYAQTNNGTNFSSMYITMIGGGSVITDIRSGHLYTYANYLCPGRYYIYISYSSSSDFTLYLYMTNANNYNYQGTFTPAHFIYNWSSSA
ncbi:MAG: hypothetical protein GYA62_07820, partial [Bacteroidales bacterium]|nr:hypothetical protein [Bacteroidales bacterium]